MRPDRIVVGEVRGGEAFDLLQAANTGHRGLLATLHAGSPDEVPGRLEAMALSAPGAVPGVVRRLVGAVDAVVQLERTVAGRRVTAVAELRTSTDGEMQAVPVRVAVDHGGLVATGVVPHWAVKLPPTALPLFEPPHPVSGEVVALPVGRWIG
jgi:pilus assembly protein CpaF